VGYVPVTPAHAGAQGGGTGGEVGRPGILQEMDPRLRGANGGNRCTEWDCRPPAALPQRVVPIIQRRCCIQDFNTTGQRLPDSKSVRTKSLIKQTKDSRSLSSSVNGLLETNELGSAKNQNFHVENHNYEDAGDIAPRNAGLFVPEIED
jgi:hypothetical protein